MRFSIGEANDDQMGGENLDLPIFCPALRTCFAVPVFGEGFHGQGKEAIHPPHQHPDYWHLLPTNKIQSEDRVFSSIEKPCWKTNMLCKEKPLICIIDIHINRLRLGNDMVT